MANLAPGGWQVLTASREIKHRLVFKQVRHSPQRSNRPRSQLRSRLQCQAFSRVVPGNAVSYDGAFVTGDTLLQTSRFNAEYSLKASSSAMA